MKLTPKEYAIYRAGYRKGYDRAVRAYEHADPTQRLAARREAELEMLADLLTTNPNITTHEAAAEALGWRLRRARRVWEAYHAS